MSAHPPEIDALLARRPEGDFAVDVGDEQIAEFHARGFTTVPRLSNDAELGWLRELYDWLFAERVQPVPGGYFDLSRAYESDGPDLQPQILSPEMRFPELRRTAVFRNGRRLAARLLGGEESGIRGWGHMIRKPAQIGAALPWHQDEAYWDPGFEYEALGVWLPLDAATRESGCMSFIPGSHRGEVRAHRHVGGDPAVHALVTDDVDPRLGVAVPMPAGGAILHHCRVLHSSGPNTSAQPRRAWANEFQRAPRPRAEPIARPWIEEGKSAWAARRTRTRA